MTTKTIKFCDKCNIQHDNCLEKPCDIARQLDHFARSLRLAREDKQRYLLKIHFKAWLNEFLHYKANTRRKQRYQLTRRELQQQWNKHSKTFKVE